MMISKKVFTGLVLCSIVIFILQYQIFTMQNLLNEINIKRNQQNQGENLLGLNGKGKVGLGIYPEKFRQRVEGESRVKVKTSYEDSLVVIYNRVPKTASTSFMQVVYQMTLKNRFNAIYVNVSAKDKTMNLASQTIFVKNITDWHEVKPAIYHGHLPYLNFAQHGSPLQPIYINIIRDPLERLVSFYYFMRYGDNKRPHLKRRRMGDKTTLDECVLQKGEDCHPNKLWLQIQYFCGHLPHCAIPGNNWALQQAKRHLSDAYHLVGVTEEIEKFIKILDLSLPRFFRGAAKKYLEGGGVFVRKTVKKTPLSDATIAFFKKTKIWKMENDFYQFALKIFNKKYDSILKKQNNGSAPKLKMYHYQKPRGPFFV